MFQPLFAVGQTKPFDTLDNILHNDQVSDSVKIDMLEHVGRSAILFSYDSGMDIAKRMLALAQGANNDLLNAHVYQIYGILHAQNGDYQNGASYFMKAYQVYKTHGDKYNLAKTVNNLAGIYSTQHEYTEALKMLDEALALQKEIGEMPGFHSSLLSKAVIYLNMDSIAQSLRYLDSCEAYFYKNNKNLYAHAISVRGEGYYKLNRFRAALHYYLRSKTLADSLGNQVMKMVNLLHLGKLYLALDSIHAAEACYLDGLELSRKIKHTENMKDAYLGLFHVYEKSGDYKKALANHVSFMETQEKVDNERTTKLIQKMKYDFQAEKQANELERYKAKAKQDKLWFVAGLLVLFFLSITLVVLTSFNRTIKRNNVKLVCLNGQIEKQNREIIFQSEQLKEANEEIKRMNEHLEERILMRTRELERQNEKLSRFAFQTSHLLRGPVARIKGLLFLLKKDQETKAEDILRRIHQSAQELDEQTSKMSSGLN